MSRIEKLTIATRESALALWQAHHVADRLRRLYPSLTVEIAGMTTRGDQTLDRPLAAIGGKGLFIKELEQALLDGRADIAVHSMKDLPAELDQRFELAVVTAREEPGDAFVSNHHPSPAALPPGSVVGTSSLRREAALRHLHPHLVVRFLRGNVQTRLARLDAGEYDGILLAHSGLLRLGLEERIARVLPVEESLPAPGQGALGIECRAGRPELLALLSPLACADTTACVKAERAVSRVLNGGCHAPVGAHAILEQDQLWLRAFIARRDGSDFLSAERRGPVADASVLGETVGEALLQAGAGAILADLTEPQS